MLFRSDCSSLEHRVAPDTIRRLASKLDVVQEDPGCEAHASLSPPSHERLFRCGCGTDTVHINAWGELSTCTFQYETRISLHEHSLRDAIDRAFAATGALSYHTDSACRTCTLHTFCDKQPTQARWEAGHPEAPIPYDCDIAVARASGSLGSPVIHPLQPGTSR